MDDNEFSKELIDAFLEESKEHIGTLEDCLLRIENPSVDEELINKSFRAIHTIKGNSGFFGLQDIHDLAHLMEEILVKIRDKNIEPDDTLISKLLSGVDVLTRMIMSEGYGSGINAGRILKELQEVISSSDQIDEDQPENSQNQGVPTTEEEEEGDDSEMEQEILSAFIEESREHVTTVEECLLKMETEGAELEQINHAFRAIHTVKGNSGFFKLFKMSHVAHAVEDVLVSVRDNQLSLEKSLISVLLRGVDTLFEMINAEDHGENIDNEQILLDLLEIQKGGPEKPSTAPPDSTTPPNQPEVIEIPDVVYANADPLHNIFRIKFDFRAVRSEKMARGNKETMLELIKKAGLLLHTDVLEKKFNQRKSGIATIYVASEKSADAIANALCVVGTTVFLLRTPDKNMETTVPELPTGKGSSQKEIDSQPAIIKSAPSDTIRIRLDLLDEIMNLTGELVLGRNQLMAQFSGLRENTVLKSHSQRVTELQESIIKTRLQPVGTVFSKFKRIVRDMALKLGKEIVISIYGEDVELDRTIIEALSDPLTHLIRNCADHALEPAEERMLAGKSRTGNITLNASHERGHVIITIEDDGRGIDIEKVRAKALQKEIITETELSQMGEKEISSLIFRPGVSTVDKVTDLSGRGVGMDVVKTSFEKIGGSVDLDSSKGKGTRITVRLPLTLAIIQSLVIDVEECRFAIPQIEVIEVVRIRREEGNQQIELVQGQPVFRLRGKLLPVVRLADVLNIKRTFSDSDRDQKDDLRERITDRRDEPPGLGNGTLNRRGKLTGRRVNPYILRLVVIRYGQHYFGLLVDAVLDPEEIVVKPLPQYVKHCKAFSGSTIMGDGSVAMILDIGGIVSMANFKFEVFSKKAAEYEAETHRKNTQEKQSVLVFNHSDSDYFALPLSMIARVEQMETDRIETAGNKEFLILPDENIELIRLENFLDIKPIERNSKTLFFIIPKLIKPTIGIVATGIVDIIERELSLTRSSVAGSGVLGTFNLNNKIILMLDIYTIFEKTVATNELTLERKKLFERAGSGKILLVEDTPFFRLMVEVFFQSAGFTVSVACDGKEALEMLQKEPSNYDIVVSDIDMPVMNGYELVKRIRSEKELLHLPVVALTALSNEESRQKGIDAGFDAYEVKIDKESLVQTVYKLLTIKRDSELAKDGVPASYSTGV